MDLDIVEVSVETLTQPLECLEIRDELERIV